MKHLRLIIDANPSFDSEWWTLAVCRYPWWNEVFLRAHLWTTVDFWPQSIITYLLVRLIWVWLQYEVEIECEEKTLWQQITCCQSRRCSAVVQGIDGLDLVSLGNLANWPAFESSTKLSRVTGAAPGNTVWMHRLFCICHSENKIQIGFLSPFLNS